MIALDNQERVWVVKFYNGVSVLDMTATWSPILIQTLLILRNISLAVLLIECAVGAFVWNKHRKARRSIEDEVGKPAKPREELEDVEVF